MKCMRCGTEVAQGTRRCPKCGVVFTGVGKAPMHGGKTAAKNGAAPQYRVIYRNGRPVKQKLVSSGTNDEKQKAAQSAAPQYRVIYRNGRPVKQKLVSAPPASKNGSRYTVKEKSIFASIVSLVVVFAILVGIYGYNSCNTGSGGSWSVGYVGGDLPANAPSSSVEGAYRVTFDLNFNADEDEIPAAQDVPAGTCATQPYEPLRENFVFMGWYKNKTDIDIFDFKTPIDKDMILYGQWVDVSDTTDTDGEGLIDAFERYYKTDLNNPDTDGDGLSDYIEVDAIRTSPLKTDTDGNGVTDDMEDYDGDGLTNGDEVKRGTEPGNRDSDFDRLSDGDEVNKYKTDPLKADTDGDGATDGDEVYIGSDPLTAQTSFVTTQSTGTPSKNNPVTLTVSATTNGAAAGDLVVEKVHYTDNMMVSRTVAGYLGSAYKVSSSGNLGSAKLTFEYDKSLDDGSGTFMPRVYYYNEKTQEYELVPNQQVGDGKIFATVNKQGTYILLNKTDFDKLFEAVIKPPLGDKQDHLDIVLVLDESGSMYGSDKNGVRKDVAKNFVSKLDKGNRAAVIAFDHSAKLLCEFNSDINVLNNAIDQVGVKGRTDIGKAVDLAIKQFYKTDTYNPDTACKFIVLLTDGDGSYNTKLTQEAKERGIIIYTIGLGNGVRESLLRPIAEGTGGQYFSAAMADNLNEIFETVLEEAVDYTKDSNNDGITDYFTKLINEGRLVLTNTSTELALCTDIFGESSDDWDNDGLKNGEEIKIVTDSNGRTKVQMKSHPFRYDTDNDGYPDSVEIGSSGSDPFSYTFSNEDTQYPYLKKTEKFYAASMVSDHKIINKLVMGFRTDKTDTARAVIADYFYDFASQESIDKNSEKIERQAKLENLVTVTNNLISIAVNLKTISEATLDVAEIQNKQTEADGLKVEITGNLKNIFSKNNSGNQEEALKLSAGAMDAVVDAEDMFKNLETSFTRFTESAKKDTKLLADLAKIAKTACEFAAADGRLLTLPFPKAVSKFETIFRKWKKATPDGFSAKMMYVDLAFDTVEFLGNAAEAYTTYSKIAANLDAYVNYLDTLDYISEDGNGFQFVRTAAGQVIDVVLNDGDFMEQYLDTLVQQEAKFAVKVFVDLGVKVLSKNAYVLVVKAAFDLGFALSGLSETSKAMMKIIIADAISDGFIASMDGIITSAKDGFFSVSSYEKSMDYLTQVYQSRLFAEITYLDLWSVKSFANMIADGLKKATGKMTAKEQYDDTVRVIESIVSKAAKAGVTIHPKLEAKAAALIKQSGS